MNKKNMTSYRVYFSDHNQRMFDAVNLLALVKYLFFVEKYKSSDIVKIEVIS